ncbi:MAG: hypothetical protein HC788_14595 [Sphingopyxis sp.]|nr:hypothetical protein [Sphingopyxis sp.]
MSLTWRWLVPQSVLYFYLSEDISLADIEHLNAINLQEITADCTGGIYVFMHVADERSYNRDMFNIKSVQMKMQLPPNLRALFVIDPYPDPAASFVGYTTLKTVGRRLLHLPHAG